MASKDTTVPEGLTGTTIDTVVLEGCRSCDRVAQERLYELSREKVYGLMVRMVGFQDAADVTQQIYLQVFRKISLFTGRSKFETWLYRLAVNEALQYLRKGNRWNFQHITQEPISQSKSEEERSDVKELLEKALSRIDPELRTIFVLREVEELCYREIAKIIDIPEGTVASRLNRARRELQQEMTSLGWES